MNKREFVIQYVLNRSLHVDRLDPMGAANDAIEAWDRRISKIEEPNVSKTKSVFQSPAEKARIKAIIDSL